MKANPNGEPVTVTAATRILLVDNQEILRVSLRLWLNSHAGLQVAADAESVAAALAHLVPPPDVVLVHLNLHAETAGSDTAHLLELRAIAGRAPVLILTSRRELELHYRAFGELISDGVKGIVFRDDASETVFAALASLHAGGTWLGPSTLARVLGKMLHVKRAQTTDPERRKVARLTQREREIIALICLGRKNKQIAQQLSLSEATVRHYLTSIFGKLAVGDRLELAIYAYRNGLEQLPLEKTPLKETPLKETMEAHPAPPLSRVSGEVRDPSLGRGRR